MTDVTTKLIHDTFVRNRPANVGVQEAEELFARWLADHAFQAEAEPSAPDGFTYEPVTSEPAGVPSDEDLMALALAADDARNAAYMLANLRGSVPSNMRLGIIGAVNDLDCAACHLTDLLDRYGYQPDFEG